MQTVSLKYNQLCTYMYILVKKLMLTIIILEIMAKK